MTRIKNIKSHIKTTGFTLIEIMIAVVIIGVLAAIALPQYQNYVIKTKRTEAQGLLIELASFMEREFTETGIYTNAVLPFTQSPKEGGNPSYNIAFSTAAAATVFTLTATPTGAQVADTNCDAISIDQAGVKCVLGGTACSDVVAQQSDVGDCW